MDIENVFSYHAPEGDQPKRYAEIRHQAKTLATAIVSNVPDCVDRDTALGKLREAVMFANAAIALKGKL